MFKLIKRVFTRTNFITLLIVASLLSVLPLSQKLNQVEDSPTLIVREVDIAPPPPPPPPPQLAQNTETASGSRGGISLESIPNGVRLLPASLTNEIGIGKSTDFGFGGFELSSNSGLSFSVDGVGFGTQGLDRQPILLVRPTLNSEYMERKGISEFSTEVMVKWLADGSLILIGIEQIEYPDPELAKLVREAVPRMRYSKPTINGEPVERFVRLPLTIKANN